MVMGVTSVSSQELVRFGDESDPESAMKDRAAHRSEDLDKTVGGEKQYTMMLALVLTRLRRIR